MSTVEIEYGEQELNVYLDGDCIMYIDKHTENKHIAMDLKNLLTDFGIIVEVTEEE